MGTETVALLPGSHCQDALQRSIPCPCPWMVGNQLLNRTKRHCEDYDDGDDDTQSMNDIISNAGKPQSEVVFAIILVARILRRSFRLSVLQGLLLLLVGQCAESSYV